VHHPQVLQAQARVHALHRPKATTTTDLYLLHVLHPPMEEKSK
jgi:hypothetical protein